jgi:hypothetical protein
MKQSAGFDVSWREISVYISDDTGRALFQGKANATPRTLAELVRKRNLIRSASPINIFVTA